MARIKRGLMRHKRHKKVLDRASGFWGRKKSAFKHAHEQVMKAGQYAFRDRRARKRDFRRLWIARISAACKASDVKYNDLIHALIVAGSPINRKMLSEIAIEDMDKFKAIVASVMPPK
jgi:large subunit ribosomal protein L20